MSALQAFKAAPLAPPHRQEAPLPTRGIGSVDIAAIDAKTAIAFIEGRLDDLQFTRIAFANAHCINVAHESPAYRSVLQGFTILADGVGVDIASKLLHGEPFPANLNGTDFVPTLFRRVSGSRRVALVGAEPGIAEAAARNLAIRFPRHDFRAISHGFFKEGLETEIVLAKLRDYSPDITLVALGVPRQELFIDRHLTIRESTVVLGVGALLDFLSGRVVRAPRLLRAMRLEWLFRLAIEPSRMWRRYVLGNPRFVWRVLAQRRRMARESRP